MEKLNKFKLNIDSFTPVNKEGPTIKCLAKNLTYTRDKLEADIENGAVQFKELPNFLNSGTYKYTVINTNCEEDGLMAVEILASLYEQTPKEKKAGKYDEEREFDPDWDWKILQEREEKEENLDYLDGFTEEELEEMKAPFYPDIDHFTQIPLVQYSGAPKSNLSGFPLADGTMAFGVGFPRKAEKPFWMEKRTDSICIVNNLSNTSRGIQKHYDEPIADFMERVSRYEHIYYVNVYKPEEMQDDFCFECGRLRQNQAEVVEMILKYSAGVVDVFSREEELKAYRELQFVGNVKHLGMELAKDFPVSKVAARIVELNYEGKGKLIEQVVNYVSNRFPQKIELTKDDFNVLGCIFGFGEEGFLEKKSCGTLATMQKLETELVGLEDIKKQVKRMVDMMRYNKAREAKGLGKSSMHNAYMFLGAPGTAKTTVAQYMGNIMSEAKLIPGGSFISINGAELKAPFVGHSAPKVHELFEENDIILIDEAYSITSENGMDSFGEEALAQLIIELEKHGNDKLVMFTGYGGKNVSGENNRMKRFIDANPGIRSRISGTFYFESYDAGQMVAIFKSMAARQNFIFDSDINGKLKDYFAERIRDENFGNGREARALLENTAAFAAERVMSMPHGKISKKALSLIKEEDLEKAINSARKAMDTQNGKDKKKCGFIM